MRTLTFRQLLLSLEAMADERDDGDLDMPVILRIQDDDGLTYLGGLTSVDVDSECTEEDALVLDGDMQADAEDEDEAAIDTGGYDS